MNRVPVLAASDVEVRYPVRVGGIIAARYGYVRAVDGVSFDVHGGETLGVVGESGCGKSSLGRAALMLTRPAAGRVTWLGDDVSAMEEAAIRPRRKDFQLVFQDPLASLNPRMIVADIIAEPLRSFYPEQSEAERQRAVREAMDRVGLLPSMAGRFPHEFSGGQCQRISIARAVILRPKLMVLDEPVSALDVSIQAQIVNLLQDLQTELQLSYLFISHDLSVVRHVCNRVLVMYLGKLVESGPCDAVFARPRHPYTQALIDAVPSPDPGRHDRERGRRLDSDVPSPMNPPSGCRFNTRCPFATERCRNEDPSLTEESTGHFVACHHWRDIEHGALTR